MRYISFLLLPIVLAACSNGIHMEETDHEGRPHILVRTHSLDYYYDVGGGGFSSIIDREGNDWIGFRMEPWGSYPASAASSFRGLPNLVFQQEDDGAGHPGHDQCRSTTEGRKIITQSLSGKWLWSWEFYDDHAILEILRTDPDRTYWFLYEGTPGGRYDPANTYVGSNREGPLPAGYDYHHGDILWGNFQWIYAGSQEASGCFYMVQPKKDDRMDMISFLGNTEAGLDSPDGMTVFGFGRERDATPMLKGPQSFVIGLYPGRIGNQEAHERLKSHLESHFLK